MENKGQRSNDLQIEKPRCFARHLCRAFRNSSHRFVHGVVRRTGQCGAPCGSSLYAGPAFAWPIFSFPLFYVLPLRASTTSFESVMVLNSLIVAVVVIAVAVTCTRLFHRSGSPT